MRPWAQLAHAVAVLLLCTWACSPPTGGGGDGGAGDADEHGQDGSTDGAHDGRPDGGPAGMVRVRGTVWSPGADLAETLEVNRFPIPGAAVIAYTTRPPAIPQGRYCNECIEIPTGTPNTLSNPIDGVFELQLTAGATYYLTVQKGEFRRVRQYTVPDTPGEIVDIDGDPSGPRPELTTLPRQTYVDAGDNIPKIAMVRGDYEDMAPMFNALGFDYDHAGEDFDIYCAANPFNPCPGPGAAQLLADPELLNQYNLIIVTCGENWPGRNEAAANNLREWVRNGGSLYVDDFNYDFVEQPWSEFLSWYVDEPMDTGTGSFTCGTSGSPSDGRGGCNNWSSYDFNGDPADVPDFAAWLGLPQVNRGAELLLYAAWDYIYELGEGEIGVDDHDAIVRSRPRVWMYNADSVPFDRSHPPATVSWPYYCGRVLYTVYHTHSSGGSGPDYELLLQEKIMMYLIMEVQTCATDPVVY